MTLLVLSKLNCSKVNYCQDAVTQLALSLYIYIYIYKMLDRDDAADSLSLYIYIYIERERERERESHFFTREAGRPLLLTYALLITWLRSRRMNTGKRVSGPKP